MDINVLAEVFRLWVVEMVGKVEFAIIKFDTELEVRTLVVADTIVLQSLEREDVPK